jgi:N-acetylglucosaminyldiphosphoundecaprenol N-acetyl-beta-D-mannosaminyltransferase
MAKVTMFDIQFDNFNFDDLLQFMDTAINNQEPSYMVTCNVDHLMKLEHDELFRTTYQNAAAVVADGVPIVWASRLLHRPLKMKLSGSDILQQLGGAIEDRQYRLFFLGAAAGVAEAAKQQLLLQYPRMQIVGCYSPTYGFESNVQENEQIVNMLKEAKPDIVLVGVGAPKQEKWIYEHYQDYRAPISIGVGATFDFISGTVKRAPVLFQRTGFEWLWRLCQEPTRLWRRYLIEDMRFLRRLLQELKKEKRREEDATYGG